MHYVPFGWRRCNWRFFVFTGLTALTICGCPPTGGPSDNGNDNEPPPGQDLVEVVIVGQGTVDQTADGNRVTLTAVPDDGWIFDGWSDARVADQNALTIIVDATEVSTITANFIADTEPPRPVDTCGNGVLDRTEECDDANTVSGDGCSPTCQLETPTPNQCGDGVVNGTEECDGGRETATCNSNCTVSHCGDSVVNVHAGEQCDDGNATDGDDCSSSCLNETPTPTGCGDGDVNGTEECDGGGSETVTCNANCTTSRCGDDIVNIHAGEQCDDGNNLGGDGCAANCRNESLPPPGGCGDGVVNGTEQCDAGGESASCNSNCTTSQCGDGIRNATAGEQCDDGNRVGGDGCEANCQSGISNDRCDAAIAVGDGSLLYSSVGATTDGPNEAACTFFDESRLESDIWYCYTASCTGTAVVSLCGSDTNYDTKLAVYSGCGCPSAPPIACSDDDCGTDLGNFHSRVTIPVTAGQSYMIRIGGFPGPDENGAGRLTIGCNVDACANGTGDCFTASPSLTPGCDEADCCAQTCELDRFCCDVNWDGDCADEAEGVCHGSFRTCGPGTGVCGTPDDTPGCDNASCCNRVCLVDPYCCLTAWDATCVDEAESMCFLTCGPGAGACHSVHATPGCDSQTCCEAICADDPFCCDTEWDQVCTDLAGLAPTVCPRQ